MKHPGENELARFAGGELSLLERWTVERHISKCPSCEAGVQDYRAAQEVLRSEMNLLPERLNWDSLAAEMTGNIRVGVAAGECVGAIPKRSGVSGWRLAAAFGGATALVLGVWLTMTPLSHRHAPKPGVIRPIAPGVTLEAKQDAIELRKNGSQLVLLHPNGNEGTTMYVSAPGSLRVSFVDKDTGQVTINRLYAD